MRADLVKPTSGKGRYANANGIRLYYEEVGAGPSVLLLHGGIMDHQSWGNQIPTLSQGFRVIAPDTRGHGRSGDDSEPFSYSLFADDFAALCQELRIARTHVVGFSDGGCTGLILARRYPNLVARMVLIGTPYNTSNYYPGRVDGFAALTPESLLQSVGPEFAEVVCKAEAQCRDGAAWRAFFDKLVHGMWTTEPSLKLADLSDVAAPTLVLHAEREQSFALEHSEAIAATVQHGELVVVPDATHTAPQEAPEFVNDAIMRFLAGA